MEVKSLEIQRHALGPRVTDYNNECAWWQRERTRLQARITELEGELIYTKLAQKIELKEGTCSGVAKETHLGKRVLDCSHCKLGESANDESKKRIEELENELKNMEDCHDASEDALPKNESCLIKFEKEVARAMVNKWVPPPEGYLKLNVDALNFWDGGGKPVCTAVGAVIRDHKGDVYRSMYYGIRGNLNDTMLKVTAMREGLRWVETLSLPDGGLIVETECIVLAEQLASGREVWSEYGLGVMECRLLLRSLDMEEIIVRRVKSAANLLAREIATNWQVYLGYRPHHDQKPTYASDALKYDHITAIVDSERPANLNYSTIPLFLYVFHIQR